MNKRQCVIEAFSHRETEYVPYNVEMTSELARSVADALGIAKEGLFGWAGNHVEKCGLEKGETIRPGFYRDEYGVVWDRSGLDKDIGILEHITFEEPDMGAYAFPGVDAQEAGDKCAAFLAAERDTFKFVKLGTTLFERAWSLRGLENVFMDFLLEEEFMHALLDKITERNMEMLDVALRYDFDGVYFGDDYGQQTSLLMSPDTWRKFIKPRLRTMFDRIKSRGLFICLHSCGNNEAILGDLIDIGLDVYQTVQPEIYDLRKLKAEYGRDLAFFGAISTQQDLPFKSPGEIRRIVRDTMDTMAVGGGYLAAPTHRMTADVPVENVVAMLDVFRNQRAGQ